MGKYLVLWQMDGSKIPIDPKERGQGYGKLLALVKQDFEKGLNIDWGAFVGEGRGYSIVEGAEVEISTQLQQYVPFCTFQVHPLMTVSQVNEMIYSLTG